MLAVLIFALLLGPAIAVLALVAVLLSLAEALSTSKERIKEKGANRQECLVCGSHLFAPVVK